ncbi:carbon-nitrogen hydrolase family protein [uncultured Roseibium sp.]|uniref:carbon-nitrogen hydrolase family protein n=1 Tax=uncultured Roseibium sp. TaxID=1936171 RepID=UPI0026276B27|nr:carbon-nitrogen hydrolase family protein [uncultured Roseibium sp.]
MATFVAACIQLRSCKTISVNTENAENLIRAAAAEGATYIQTPEMSNVLVRSRSELLERISVLHEDKFLKMGCRLASDLSVHLHIGSLAILLENGKVANRAVLISPNGKIAVFYDKIHMFDVDLPNGESWRESATYAPGNESVIVELSGVKLGMAICYDVRFPEIFRAQSRLGAEVLTAPAAFTRQTGKAHWHVLQRARAIENGAYVISAAQGGNHEDGRETYGHSVIVDPWGKIIAELEGDEPGYVLAEIDKQAVEKARSRIPAIANERQFECKVTEALKEEPA